MTTDPERYLLLSCDRGQEFADALDYLGNSGTLLTTQLAAYLLLLSNPIYFAQELVRQNDTSLINQLAQCEIKQLDLDTLAFFSNEVLYLVGP